MITCAAETVTRLASDAHQTRCTMRRRNPNALTDSAYRPSKCALPALRFREESSRARRSVTVFSVVMLDLDDVQIGTDSFGHKVGDKMLREMDRLFRANFVESYFLARYAATSSSPLFRSSRYAVDDLRERSKLQCQSFRECFVVAAELKSASVSVPQLSA